tara:strand:- start:276 stop:461 length:186 start_codon:yes stop_codon:yes gene_type:complete
MIKLKDILKEDNNITKFNVRISINGQLEGDENDVLKFKKYLEEKIQDCLEKYNIQANWRLD